MSFNFVNDWKSSYGGSVIMISWLRLDDYFSFTFVVLGIGFSLSKGTLNV